MAATNPCNNDCPTPIAVAVPGAPGTHGGAGTNGTNGTNAFSLIGGGGFNVPAAAGTTVSGITVDQNSWIAVGATVVVSGAATFLVAAKPTSTTVNLTWVNAQGDVAAGTNVPAGSILSPSGRGARLLSVNQLTDNTTGVASDTLSVGVGVYILPIYVQLAQITATTICQFTPGHRFSLQGIAFSAEIAVTTAAKLATLTPSIGGVSVTGGALALTSANCTPKGTTVAGSAITAANTGTNAQVVGVVASAVTPFTEGTGWVFLKIQNLDVADAFATLASHVNSVQTNLKT